MAIVYVMAIGVSYRHKGVRWSKSHCLNTDLKNTLVMPKIY